MSAAKPIALWVVHVFLLAAMAESHSSHKSFSVVELASSDWSSNEDLVSCDWSSEVEDLVSCNWSSDREDLASCGSSSHEDMVSCDWCTSSNKSDGEKDGLGETKMHSTASHSLARTPVSIERVVAVRRSPRVPKPKKKPAAFEYDTARKPQKISENSGAVASRKLTFDEDGWSLRAVMEMPNAGCSERCTVEVHGLSEYDILLAHNTFWSKTYSQQRQWLLDYFVNHCPSDPTEGSRDPRELQE